LRDEAYRHAERGKDKHEQQRTDNPNPHPSPTHHRPPI
jgi:hypothetical protein